MNLSALPGGVVRHRSCCCIITIAVSLCSAAQGAEPQLYFLKPNESSFFISDHLTGATYYRFGTGGSYEETAREHMGIFPFGSGTWRQDTNGIVSIVSTNKDGRERPQARAIPMIYKEQVFLIWPDKWYTTNTAQVMQKIDAAAKKLHVYNPFQITGAHYSKGTAQPYPFKFYTNLNPPEASAPK